MRLKNFLCGLLIVLFITGMMNAQPMRPPSAKEKVRQLKNKLELTDDQAKQLETILKSSESKIKTMMEKMEVAREEAVDEMDKIIAGENKEVEKVLNDTQKKEYAKMKKEMKKCPPSQMGNMPGAPMGNLQAPPMNDRQNFPREGQMPPPPPGDDEQELEF